MTAPVRAASERLLKSRPALIFGGALCIALAVFAVWDSQQLVDTRHDPYGFLEMGTSVARGNGFTGYGEVLSRRGPLYALFIGALYVVFGEHPLAVQLAQCVLFGVLVVLAYDTARRLFNERTALFAAAFCAFNPSLLRYVPDFHLESLLAFLFTLAVWCAARFVGSPSVRTGIPFGIAAGLAALTKPTVVLYAPLLLAVWVLLTFLRTRTLPRANLVAGAAVALGMCLVILPWTARNYQSTGGKFVLITTGAGDAFLRGYVFSKWEYATLQRPPYTDAENESNAMFSEICKANGAVWGPGGPDDLALEKMFSAEAKKRLLADPLAFVRKFVTGLFTFWYEMTSLKTSLVAGLAALAAWVLALCGVRRSLRERRAAWVLWVPIAYMNLFLAAMLALGRYSVPILPCLWILAAFGVDTLLTARRGEPAGVGAGHAA